MRIKATSKVGDILYRVDPQKLSVKAHRIDNSDEGPAHASTNYENFAMEKKEQKPLHISIEKFPFEFKGSLYFLTEDDANHYIKTQIGM